MLWLGILPSLILIALALLGLFFKQFHRDPDRAVPGGNCIVAPADGRVLDVIEWAAERPLCLPKGILGRVKAIADGLGDSPYYVIPVFMSPFDVHIQRAPIDGTVVSLERRPGRFKAAYSLDALENETVETVIETRVGRIKVLQTAGVLVRRIHNWLRPGQHIRKGERIGKIDFGSQVTLLLPKKAGIVLNIRAGDKVRAGETIVARINDGWRGRA